MHLGWFELSLVVQDIERSIAFYEKLGFQIVADGADARTVTLLKDDCRIGLYEGVLDPPETQLIFWQGDVKMIARELAGKGIRFEKEPFVGDGGGTAALLRDPDGHPLYFVNMPGITRDDPASERQERD